MDDLMEREGEGSRAGMDGAEVADTTPAPEDAKPRQRTRQTLVCAECKRLKLKCDRRMPCDQCLKRETVHKCLYQPNASDRVDVHSLNNKFKDNERRFTAVQDGLTEKVTGLNEKVTTLNDGFRELKDEMKILAGSVSTMRTGMATSSVSYGQQTPSHPHAHACCAGPSSHYPNTPSQNYNSGASGDRHRYRYQNPRPPAANSSRIGTAGGGEEGGEEHDVTVRNGVTRAVLVVSDEGYADGGDGLLFADSSAFELDVQAVSLRELGVDLGGVSRTGARRMNLRLGGDSRSASPPAVRFPELAALFKTSSSQRYRVTSQLASRLPSKSTCDVLLAKLKDSLAVGIGSGLRSMWFERRVNDILSSVRAVDSGGRLAKSADKGKGKAVEGASTDADASREGNGMSKKVTLAQFALLLAALAVAAKWVVEAKRVKASFAVSASQSSRSPAAASSSTADFSDLHIDATLPTVLYNLADTALSLQSGVERYNLDSVVALILQGVFHTFSPSADADMELLRCVARDALDRAVETGLNVDPSAIVLGRPRDTSSGREERRGEGEAPRKRKRGTNENDEGVVVKEEERDDGGAGASRDKGKMKESWMETTGKSDGIRLTSFEAEVRRSVWWSVVLLEQFRSHVTSSTPMIYPDSLTTRIPTPTFNSSYVALGDAVMKSNISIDPVPPSEPSSLTMQYFVARCRFTKMLMDVRHQIRQVDFDATLSPTAATEFINDVTNEASRLLNDLPNELHMSIAPGASNADPIHFEPDDQDNGAREIDAILTARQCDLLIAAQSAVRSTYWLLVGSRSIPDGPSKETAVSGMFCLNQNIIYASRMLFALAAQPNIGTFTSSALLLERTLYDAGLVAANIVTSSSSAITLRNLGGIAIVNVRAVLEVLKHPAISGSPSGELSDAAKIIEELVLKADAKLKLNEPERRSKRKRGEVDGEPVGGGTSGDERANSIAALPLKHPTIMLEPTQIVPLTRTSETIVIVDAPTTEKIIVEEDFSMAEVQVTSSATLIVSPSVPVQNNPTAEVDVAKLLASARKGNSAFDDDAMASRRTRAMGSSSIGGENPRRSDAFVVRQRGKDGKSLDLKKKGRRDKSSRSTTASQSQQPSHYSSLAPSHSSLSPMDAVGHPRPANTIAPSTPVPSVPVYHTSMVPEAMRMAHTPQTRGMTPTHYCQPETPAQPPPQIFESPSPISYQTGHGASQIYHSPIQQPSAYNAMRPISRSEFMVPPAHQQAQSSPEYYQFFPAHSSRSPSAQRPSISSAAGTEHLMDSIGTSSAFPAQGGVNSVPFEVRMPPHENMTLTEPPPMSSLQTDAGPSQIHPLIQYSEHAMQFTPPHDATNVSFLAQHGHGQPTQHNAMLAQQPPYNAMPQTIDYSVAQGMNIHTAAKTAQDWPQNNQGAGFERYQQ